MEAGFFSKYDTTNKTNSKKYFLMILISTSFLSLESPSKTSKLLPSSCASNAEQSVVSSSTTADGIIQFFRDLHNFIFIFFDSKVHNWIKNIIFLTSDQELEC